MPPPASPPPAPAPKTFLLTGEFPPMQTRFARKTAKALLGSAVAVVANSQWTREQAQKVLRELGLDPLAETVRLVPLGTDPEQFRPAIDTRAVRERYGLNGGAWVLTVARL